MRLWWKPRRMRKQNAQFDIKYILFNLRFIFLQNKQLLQVDFGVKWFTMIESCRHCDFILCTVCSIWVRIRLHDVPNIEDTCLYLGHRLLMSLDCWLEKESPLFSGSMQSLLQRSKQAVLQHVGMFRYWHFPRCRVLLWPVNEKMYKHKLTNIIHAIDDGL